MCLDRAPLTVAGWGKLCPHCAGEGLLPETIPRIAENFDRLDGAIGPDDHALMLCMHHAISDGWSLGVLSEEFAAIWAADIEQRRRIHGTTPTPPAGAQ